MFGLFEHISVWGAVVTVPVFAWELSLALWLIFKGFDDDVVTSSEVAVVIPPAREGSLANAIGQ